MQQKRAFAKYWDKVDDARDISGTSRFLSGGIGGITSQLSAFIIRVSPNVSIVNRLSVGIYPIETLKVRVHPQVKVSSLLSGRNEDSNDEQHWGG